MKMMKLDCIDLEAIAAEKIGISEYFSKLYKGENKNG